MSESMVERVARAMFDRRYGPDTDWQHMYTADAYWDANYGGEAESWRDFARAAIAAMREPTPPMARVGGDTDGMDFEGIIGDRAATEAWRAMIDEALT